MVAVLLSFLTALIYFSKSKNQKKTVLLPVTEQKKSALPIKLVIPKINVNADIQYVGITPKGAMAIPNNATDVGWFKLGPQPGEIGSAVIAGHFDGPQGQLGVFTNLYQLKKGDKLSVLDNAGNSQVFIVRDVRIYPPGFADIVFSQNDDHYLNLITCDGLWDGSKKSYNQRLVVFTQLIN